MRCKGCGKCVKANRSNKSKSWQKYQLCGGCCALEHPEEYKARVLATKIKEWQKRNGV
jgi:hypothetical protein